MLSLKAGTYYSAYLFTNLNDIVGGTFDTKGVDLAGNGKSGKGLSHATLFVLNQPEVPVTPPTGSQPVPEPFTIMGTVVATGFGYRLKRQRDKARRA